MINSSTYSHDWISDVLLPVLYSQGRVTSPMKHKYGKAYHSDNDGTIGCLTEWEIAFYNQGREPSCSEPLGLCIS